MICDDIKKNKLEDFYQNSMNSINIIEKYNIKKGSDEHLDNISNLNRCFNLLNNAINLYNNELQKGLELGHSFSKEVVNQTLELSNSFTIMLINYKTNPLYKNLLTDLVNSVNDELTRMYSIIPYLVNFDDNSFHEFEYFQLNDNVSLIAQSTFDEVWSEEDDEYWNSYL